MKIFFTVFLVLHTLTELLAAGSLIGGPEGISAPGLGGQWSMHYGFAALALASATLWIWPYRSNRAAVTAVLGTLMTFHIGILISLTTAGDQQVGMVLHSVLAVLAVTLFSLRSKWCDQ